MRTTLDLDLELHRELKMYCAMEGIKMADVLRRIIAEFLERKRKMLKIR